MTNVKGLKASFLCLVSYNVVVHHICTCKNDL